MVRVMAGVRVLEVASWTYVPAAGAVLAEWGADVIKIEHPETGDPQRGLVSSGLLPSGTVDFTVELPNRGKRSVGLDIGSDEGREILLQIAASSDVFVTSFLPSVRRKLHIDVDDIRAVNPDIIYVRGSALGQRGPESERGGYDFSTYWGRGGSSDTATGADAAYPVGQPGGAYGDVIGGLTIAGGICAALLHRDRTGEALIVDSSLLAMGAWATGFSVAASCVFGIERMGGGTRYDSPNPAVGTYKTKDARFISVVLLQADRYWPDFVKRLGHPVLQTDERFASASARVQNKRECIDLLDEAFAARTLVGVEGDPRRLRRRVGAGPDRQRGGKGSAGAGERLHPRCRRRGRQGVQAGGRAAAVRRDASGVDTGAQPWRAHRRGAARARSRHGPHPGAEDQWCGAVTIGSAAPTS